MDNDLMARRLRPPSEPNHHPNGQHGSRADEPAWDPTPDTRSDIPWDRPALEPWPPTSPVDEAADGPWLPASPALAAQPEQPALSPQTEPSPPGLSVEEAPAVPAAADPMPTVAEVPWDRPSDSAEQTDLQADGPTWDRPAPYDLNEPDVVDDRPAEMLDAFANIVPAIASVTRAPSPESLDADPLARDPYDASAPVLADITRPVTSPDLSTWDGYRPSANGQSTTPPASEPFEPAANPPSDETVHLPESTVPAAGAQLPVPAAGAQLPVPPRWFAERALGPTPPEGLFSSRPTPAGDEPAEVTADRPEAVEPLQFDEWTPASEQPQISSVPEPVQSPPTPEQPAVPNPTSIAPAGPTNVVLRIELAIIDETRRLSPVEVARRIGPSPSDREQPADEWVVPTETGEHERFTPRHPEFEPRNHLPPEPEPAPAPAFEAPMADEPVSLPWGLPALEPDWPAPPPPWAAPAQQSAPAQPPLSMAEPRWTAAPAAAPFQSFEQHEPQPFEPIRPAPHELVQPQWGTPQPQWGTPVPASDPLASLPAIPAISPAPYAPMVPTLAAASGTPWTSPRASTGVAAAANTQADLWFLASEPASSVEEEAAASEGSREPSSLLTAGLTIGMAILVIVLVLVFIQLMTSLLR